MKKRTRTVYFLFTLCVSFCVTMFSSCPEPFGSGYYETNIPDGMGSFTLSASTARTILPQTPDFSDFTSYTYVFTAVIGGQTKTVPNLTNATRLDPVILDPGTYDLTVTALIGGSIAARGTLNGIVINTGANTNGSVVLRALLNEGMGTFSWSITPAPSADTATMKIYKNNAQEGAVVDLMVASNGSRSSLASGIYTVTIEMTQIGNGKKLVWNEIMHVYSALESNFTKVFTDAHFNNPVWNVTINYNYTGSTSLPQSVVHGYCFNANSLALMPSASRTADAYLYKNADIPISPAVPGFTLEGWYTKSNPTITDLPFDFAATPIHDNITLYAKWTGAIDVSGRTGANDIERAIDYVKVNTGAYTLIVVAPSLNITEQSISQANFDLTIQSIDNTEKIIQYAGAANNRAFIVSANGASLTLGNRITLKGIAGSTASLVRVEGGGNFVMKSGSIITGHSANTEIVSVSGAASVFTIDGGEVTGNEYTGLNNSGIIYVSAGTLNMISGSIDSNLSSSDASAVYLTGAGKFNMSGGSVTDNTSTRTENISSAVYVPSGTTFTMTGGNITENKSGYSGVSQADVYLQSNTSLLYMQGGASIGSLTLNALSADAASSVILTGQLTGISSNIEALNLSGATTSTSVIGLWNDKAVVKTNNYNITQNDINKIALGELRPSGSGTPALISATHELELVGNDGILKEKPAVAVWVSGGGLTEQPFATLKDALAEITTADTYTVKVASHSSPPAEFPVNNAARIVSLEPKSGSAQVQLTGNGRLVTVANGVTLTLRSGITLKGHDDNDLSLVYINFSNANGDAKFIMESGSEISGNTNKAVIGPPGGIVNCGIFVMNGGKISGNTSNTQYGGGVCNMGDFTMNGGEISGNTTSGYGGGIYNGKFGNITLGGTAKIYANQNSVNTALDNVYLEDGTYITLGDGTNGANAPTANMEVFVQTATASGVIVDTGASAGQEKFFKADTAGKVVAHEGVQLKIVDEPGTAGNPFLVENEDDLRAVGRGGTEIYTTGKYVNWTMDKHYKMTANITMTQGNWTRLGSYSRTFSGTFDGNGHVITGLVIRSTDSTQPGAGIFYIIESTGIVQNLGLIDVDVRHSYGRTGSIAAENKGKIENCYVTGTITSTSTNQVNVGGIAGTNTYGIISNCFTAVKINASGYFVGGISGANAGTGARVSNCIALNETLITSGVSSSDSAYVGRISGQTGLQNNRAWMGMLVETGSTWTIANSLTGKDGLSISSLEAKTKSTWEAAGFLFTDSSPTAGPWVWDNSGSLMPGLNNSTAPQWPAYLVEIGTANNPIEIKTEADLKRIGTSSGGYTPNAHYKLMNDIVLTGSWTPLASFTGIFDGNGYVIDNLNTASGTSRGLFSSIGAAGVVKNLGLTNVNITGTSSVGSVAGQNAGKIENCYVTGSITSTSTSTTANVGGLTGTNSAATSIINNCFTAVSITASGGNVGGIAGNNAANATVTNCVAFNEIVTTTLETTANIGRITGITTGTRANNYAWSGMTVTGGAYVANKTATGKDGEDLTTSQIKTETNWETAGFKFTDSTTPGPWIWNGTSGMPSLGGTITPWPSYINITGQTGGIKITFPMVDKGASLPITNATISRSGAGGKDTFVIYEITNPNDYTTIQWYSSDGLLNTTDLTKQASVTIYAYDFGSIGPKPITLIVTDSSNDSWSCTITVTVEN